MLSRIVGRRASILQEFCYKEWQAGKEERESERALASMSTGEKARAERKRKAAATVEEHVEQPVLVQRLIAPQT